MNECVFCFKKDDLDSKLKIALFYSYFVSGPGVNYSGCQITWAKFCKVSNLVKALPPPLGKRCVGGRGDAHLPGC